jgi:hypothetical protein
MNDGERGYLSPCRSHSRRRQIDLKLKVVLSSETQEDARNDDPPG